MFSRMGTIEKYWKAIPNVQASPKSTRKAAESVPYFWAAKPPTVQPNA